jgi:hypothetical protein
MSLNPDEFLGVIKSVTKEWTKQRKAEERNCRARYSRQYVYSDRVDFTEVAHEILPPGYEHASGNGRYSVSKRQFFYACRDQFLNRTGRELEFGYFAGTLLVQYMNRHPETERWKVTADPRGTLTIPNAGHGVQIPVGTIAIDGHLREAGKTCNPFDDLYDAVLPVGWPSLAGGQRYRGVLYIEKEGFEPLLKEARIAERFDLAILSCKGQSVVAARRFVDEVCRVGGGARLGVVHDFDKAGFEISQRLTTISQWAEDNDRVTYRFRNEIDVTDLGLRLTDIHKYGLESRAETCKFDGRFAADSIATEEEKEFLQSDRRVELNAFTSPEFVAWLEEVLTRWLGKERLIPGDDVLAKAYRKALAVAQINKAVKEAREGAIEKAEGAPVPDGLRKKLKRGMKKTGEAWDRALYELVRDGQKE